MLICRNVAEFQARRGSALPVEEAVAGLSSGRMHPPRIRMPARPASWRSPVATEAPSSRRSGTGPCPGTGAVVMGSEGRAVIERCDVASSGTIGSRPRLPRADRPARTRPACTRDRRHHPHPWRPDVRGELRALAGAPASQDRCGVVRPDVPLPRRSSPQAYVRRVIPRAAVVPVPDGLGRRRWPNGSIPDTRCLCSRRKRHGRERTSNSDGEAYPSRVPASPWWLRTDGIPPRMRRNLRRPHPERRGLWRRWGVEAQEVDGENFLTEYEAILQLHLSGGALSAGLLKSSGVLEPAFLPDGTEGVTRMSVERELEWRRSAPLWRRVLRRLRRWISYL